MPNYIKKMTGYKATKADMSCSGETDGKPYFHQFKLGKWYEIKGELELCKKGFHFCLHPSGPLYFYSASDSRVFEVEAEDVLEVPTQAGADFKLVAKRIKLVKEITSGLKKGVRNSGYGNSGDRNSGDRNSGDRNSGDRNSGYGNSGDMNSGDRNSGYGNSGYGNSGDRNSGYRNSGDRNSGYGNSGYRNSGDRNSGDRNSGDRNSGYGNSTNFSSGFFCIEEPKVISFDIKTNLTRSEFLERYPESIDLSNLLHEKDEIDFNKFSNIPGITPKKLKILHKSHLDKKLIKT